MNRYGPMDDMDKTRTPSKDISLVELLLLIGFQVGVPLALLVIGIVRVIQGATNPDGFLCLGLLFWFIVIFWTD